MLPLDPQFDKLIMELEELGQDYRVVLRNKKHIVTNRQGKNDKVVVVFKEIEDVNMEAGSTNRGTNQES